MSLVGPGVLYPKGCARALLKVAMLHAGGDGGAVRNFFALGADADLNDSESVVELDTADGPGGGPFGGFLMGGGAGGGGFGSSGPVVSGKGVAGSLATANVTANSSFAASALNLGLLDGGVGFNSNSQSHSNARQLKAPPSL